MDLVRLSNGEEVASAEAATATSATDVETGTNTEVTDTNGGGDAEVTDDGPTVALRLLATGDLVAMPKWVAAECTTLKDLMGDVNDDESGDAGALEIPIAAPTSHEAPTVDDAETVEWIVRFASAARTADETARAGGANLEKRTAIARRDADVQMSVFDELDEADERADEQYAAAHDGDPPETPRRRLLNLMVSANYLNYERAKRAAARHAAILIERVTENVSPEEGGAAIRKLLMPYAAPPAPEPKKE